MFVSKSSLWQTTLHTHTRTLIPVLIKDPSVCTKHPNCTVASMLLIFFCQKWNEGALLHQIQEYIEWQKACFTATYRINSLACIVYCVICVVFISCPLCLCSGGCTVLPLPGEVPAESSVCPYCIYNQLSDNENVNEQPEDQLHGYSNSCHGNCQCLSSSPCHCSGDAQVSEPKKRLWERCWAGIRTKLELIVGSRYFSRGIMIAILINTLSMGIEYHEQVCLCVSVCVC